MFERCPVLRRFQRKRDASVATWLCFRALLSLQLASERPSSETWQLGGIIGATIPRQLFVSIIWVLVHWMRRSIAAGCPRSSSQSFDRAKFAAPCLRCIALPTFLAICRHLPHRFGQIFDAAVSK
jgi:hypothetical protein